MSEAVVLDFTNCKFVIKCSMVANKIATAVLPVVMKKKGLRFESWAVQ